MAMQGKFIRDAVHGDMEFDNWELGIINTPEFQRMRGIRQLGLAHLIYPSAQHTRFEHSLGVAHMADRIVQAVGRNDGRIAEKERRFIRLLALVHDIGHIPFGHTLEDERPVLPREQHHDDETRLMLFLGDTPLAEAIAALGTDIERPNVIADILAVMRRTHEDEGNGALPAFPRAGLFAAIVGNTICADLLDYLERDPYFTGLQHRYDERIISGFTVEDDEICLDLDDGGQLRRSVASEIMHLLRLRYTLGERVYYHLTKSAASAMISKAVELSGLSHRALAPLRDEELLYVLENADTYGEVGGETVQHRQDVARLVEDLRSRRLYQPVYTITREGAGHYREKLVETYHSVENAKLRSDAELTLATHIGAKSHQVIIYCPAKGMSTKAAMVKVRWPKVDRPLPLEDLCDQEGGMDDGNMRDEIRQLRRKHEALWQMTVFLDPDCIVQAARLSGYCQEVFHEIPNCSSSVHGHLSSDAVRLDVLLEAITTHPHPEELDMAACRGLTARDGFKRRDVWTVEAVQEGLPRKTPLQIPEAGAQQLRLIPDETET
jgi:HD superfamily phosphohydrolase